MPSKSFTAPADDAVDSRVSTAKRNPQDDTKSVAETAGGPPESRMTRIARRAHEIYMARGGEDGKAMTDWLQAEREIDADA